MGLIKALRNGDQINGLILKKFVNFPETGKSCGHFILILKLMDGMMTEHVHVLTGNLGQTILEEESGYLARQPYCAPIVMLGDACVNSSLGSVLIFS